MFFFFFLSFFLVCSSDDLPTVVHHYITTNPDLHQKVLQHEPIWLEEFLKELKAQNYKFKKDRLMDYFDEQVWIIPL